MSIVVLKLPDVKREQKARPQKCPYCEGETFQRWGQVKKAVKDTKKRNLRVDRYRCCHCEVTAPFSCKRTFRYYPKGCSSAD